MGPPSETWRARSFGTLLYRTAVFSYARMVSSALSSLRTRFRSQRISRFTESVIRDMTRQAMAKGAINLAQGFPDFPAPVHPQEGGHGCARGRHQSIFDHLGRQASARRDCGKISENVCHGVRSEQEITVCCGATEGMVASLLAVLNPGDEVVLFEPFYENYGPDTQLCGAETRYVTPACT